jgi:hypothetical protein
MKRNEYLNLNIHIVSKYFDCSRDQAVLEDFENWENIRCDNCGHTAIPEDFELLNIKGYENIKGYRGENAKCPECGITEKWKNIEDNIDNI